MVSAADLHYIRSGDRDCTSDCAGVSDGLLERADMPYMY